MVSTYYHPQASLSAVSFLLCCAVPKCGCKTALGSFYSICIQGKKINLGIFCWIFQSAGVYSGTGLTDHPVLIRMQQASHQSLNHWSHPYPKWENPPSLPSGSKTQVPVVACVSASWQSIPALVIWKRKLLTAEMAKFYGKLLVCNMAFLRRGGCNENSSTPGSLLGMPWPADLYCSCRGFGFLSCSRRHEINDEGSIDRQLDVETYLANISIGCSRGLEHDR